MSDLTNPESFSNEVRAAFAGLVQRGALRVLSSTYSPECFGNAAVELGGQNFAVRVIGDRGEQDAEARPLASPEWSPLDWVLRAVGARDLPEWGLLPVPQAARLIAKNITLLEAGCAPESLEETLRRLGNIDATYARALKGKKDDR